MKVDNDHDGVEDITFQFRFTTEIRTPGVFTGFVGNLAGIPPITALDGPGSEGLNLRQRYTVEGTRPSSRIASATAVSIPEQSLRRFMWCSAL